jgi:hypothetical protein
MSESMSSGSIRSTTSISKVGGALGVAGTMIGFAIFVAACAATARVRALADPLILGSVGLILTLFGGFFSKDIAMEDPQVVACYLINIAVIAARCLRWRSGRTG